MMLRFLLVVSAVALSVHADLTCLEWGLLLTPLGLWCHFKDDSFNYAESAAVNAAETMATEVKDAAVFTIKHHPLVLEYEYTETAIKNGTAAANSQLRGQLHDEVKVGIGMGKELANTAVNIYELTHWEDLTLCLMQSAQEVALKPQAYGGNITDSDALDRSHSQNAATSVRMGTEKVRRATSISNSQASIIVDRCASQKFRQLTRPAIFNITDSKEKIGSTLTQMATFFVPVAPEAEGAKLAMTGLDLAIPGSEDAGRIFQKVGEESRHFESEAYALEVKEHLDEPAWVQENCNTCAAPIGSLVARTRRHLKPRRVRPDLLRRGAAMSLCCCLPPITTDVDPEETRLINSDRELEAGPFPSRNIVSKANKFSETSLSPAPALMKWSDSALDSSKIMEDLSKHDTALVAWSSELTKIMPSGELFKILRGAFEAETPAQRELAAQLRIIRPDWDFVESISSLSWARQASDNAEMVKIQDFAKEAFTQAANVLRNLRSMREEEIEALHYRLDINYIPPMRGPAGMSRTEGNMHFSSDKLQLEMGDQPGLVIERDNERFRLPEVESTWHLLPGSDWARQGDKFLLDYPMTRHAVFGPAIAKHGRVSVRVSVS